MALDRAEMTGAGKDDGRVHNIDMKIVQEIMDAASEACAAFWGDPDEKRLYPAMKKLADLFTAVRILDDIDQLQEARRG